MELDDDANLHLSGTPGVMFPRPGLRLFLEIPLELRHRIFLWILRLELMLHVARFWRLIAYV